MMTKTIPNRKNIAAQAEFTGAVAE